MSSENLVGQSRAFLAILLPQAQAAPRDAARRCRSTTSISRSTTSGRRSSASRLTRSDIFNYVILGFASGSGEAPWSVARSTGEKYRRLLESLRPTIRNGISDIDRPVPRPTLKSYASQFFDYADSNLRPGRAVCPRRVHTPILQRIHSRQACFSPAWHWKRRQTPARRNRYSCIAMTSLAATALMTAATWRKLS